MHLCVDSRLFCVAGNTHVVLFNFTKLDASIDCPVCCISLAFVVLTFKLTVRRVADQPDPIQPGRIVIVRADQPMTICACSAESATAAAHALIVSSLLSADQTTHARLAIGSD